MPTRRDSLLLVCQGAFSIPAIARAAPARVAVTSFLRDAASTPGRQELQAALDASSQQQIPAYIPAKCRVILDGPVVLGDGCSLVGDGKSSVIAADYSQRVSNCLIRNDWRKGNPGIKLTNFAIDRSGPGVQHGILLNGVDGLLVDRLYASGVTHGIAGVLAISSIMNASGNAPRLLSRGIKVTGCSIDDCGNFGVQVGKVDQIIIADNFFNRAFREAIGIEPESCDTASRIQVIRNMIQASPNLPQGTQTGLIIATLTSGGEAIRGLIVENNTIAFAASARGSFNPGIGVYGEMDAIIRNNTIVNSSGPGIQLGNAYQIIASCGKRTIKVSGRAVGVTVTRNKIFGANQGRNPGPRSAAIYEAVGKNSIFDNVVR